MTASRRRGACPALSAPMETGDGLLVRLMPADGTLSPAALAGLARAARDFGNGILEVTARGSLQVRGLRAETVGPLNAAVDALGIQAREGLAIDVSALSGLDAAEIADGRPVAEAIRAGVSAFAGRLGPKVSVVIDGGGAVFLDEMKADVRLKARRHGGWDVSLAGDARGAVFLGRFDVPEAVSAIVALLAEVAALGPTARMADVLKPDGPTLPPPLRGRVEVGSTAPPGSPSPHPDEPYPPPCPAPQGGRVSVVRGAARRPSAHRRVGESMKSHARNLRADMTDAERMLWRHLRMKTLQGSPFRRQVPMGPYIADFVCHSARLVIEVDGGQHAERRLQEERRDTWFANAGYRVVRYWNNDILSNIDGVLQDISAHLAATPSALPPPPLRGRGGVGGRVPPGSPSPRPEDPYPPPCPPPQGGRFGGARIKAGALLPLKDNTFAVAIALPFGAADSEAIAALAEAAAHLGARDLRPAPPRMLLAVGLLEDSARSLAEKAARLGFILDPADPRLSVIACPGAPACASGRIPARALAARIAETLAPLLDGTLTVHVSGCAKGCAHPAPASLAIVGRDDQGMDSSAGLVRHGTAGAEPEAVIPVPALLPALARLTHAERRPGESGADLLTRLPFEAMPEPSS